MIYSELVRRYNLPWSCGEAAFTDRQLESRSFGCFCPGIIYINGFPMELDRYDCPIHGYAAREQLLPEDIEWKGESIT